MYGRDANPTVEILEQKVAALEEGAAGIAFASGMAAASAGNPCHLPGWEPYYLYEGCVSAGQNNPSSVPDSQSGHERFFLDGLELDRLEGMITEKTSLILLESPATFVFTVTDLEGVAEIARKHGVKTYIDNTYCTPLYQKPLRWALTSSCIPCQNISEDTAISSAGFW